MNPTPTPKWYMPAAGAALLWNLLGCVAYLSDVTLSAEDLAAMTAAQQAMYASRPWWPVAATATAVWAGAAGCLGLLLRKRWAVPLLVASLVGVLIQDLALFVLTDAGSLGGPVALALQGVVLAVALGLVVLGRKAVSNGWAT